MPVYAQFGNSAPIGMASEDVPTDGAVTYVEFGENGVEHAVAEFTDPDGAWANQSTASAPLWVACSDPDIESALAAHYNIPTRVIPGLNS